MSFPFDDAPSGESLRWPISPRGTDTGGICNKTKNLLRKRMRSWRRKNSILTNCSLKNQTVLSALRTLSTTPSRRGDNLPRLASFPFLSLVVAAITVFPGICAGRGAKPGSLVLRVRGPGRSPDDLFTCKRLFLLNFCQLCTRLSRSLDVVGSGRMVGRLGLEPRTKALKGPCSTN